jgi:hypothetical protein
VDQATIAPQIVTAPKLQTRSGNPSRSLDTSGWSCFPVITSPFKKWRHFVYRKTCVRGLSLERLEQRALMATNVTAAVNANHVLEITGDDRGNFIEIRQLAAPPTSDGSWPGARYQIINPYGTPTLINGRSSVIVEGVKNGMVMNMGGGYDKVNIYRPNALGKLATIPGQVNIDLGSGGDILDARIINHAQVNIEGGSEDDYMTLYGNLCSSTITGAAGRDSLYLRATVGGTLSADMGDGNDGIDFTDFTSKWSTSQVSVTMGNGTDDVETSGYNANGGLLKIDTGANDDAVNLNLLQGLDRLILNTGSGPDGVSISGASVTKLIASLDEGDDYIYLNNHVALDEAVLDGGDGTDTLGIGTDVTIKSQQTTGFEDAP